MEIVIVIMVKNEEEKICDTLQPFIDSEYKKFMVCDTGSTDKTIEKVKSLMELHNCSFIIEEDTYENFNFSIARNKCLEYTRQHFSDCKYMMMIDCEWYIIGALKLKQYMEEYDGNKDLFMINLICNGTHAPKNCLMTISSNYEYSGSIHECISGDYCKIPNDIYFNYNPTKNGSEKSHQRHKRDVEILLETYNTNKNSRDVFYLAQTYENLNDYDNAILYYKERSSMNGHDEETFYSYYSVGRLYHATFLNTNNKEDWNNAITYYIKSYHFRPSRVEPLIQLSSNLSEDYKIRYMYAKTACLTPFPKDDVLFVNEYLYKSTRWYNLALAASWMGDEYLDETLDALNRTIKHNHNNGHILSCIKNIKDRIKKRDGGVDENIKENSNNINLNILNLILYSKEYESMYKIMSKYLKDNNIKHYFYCYQENLCVDHMIIDDIIYFNGVETYTPGILEKTILALDFVKELNYDYIVRSNISTVINWDLLKINLNDKKIDYGGPIYYNGSFVDLNAGLTEEKNKLYGKYGFASGICIILSKNAVNFILSNKNKLISYEIVDDVALGILINSSSLEFKTGNIGTYIFNDIKSGYMAYRNKSNDREDDINRMTYLCSNI